jgi:hypothetical protein
MLGNAAWRSDVFNAQVKKGKKSFARVLTPCDIQSMKTKTELTDMQFCRALAFVEFLRMIDEKVEDKKLAVHPLDDKTKVLSPDGKLVTRQSLTIKALQDNIEAKASQYGQLLGVDFPDENVPEALPDCEAIEAQNKLAIASDERESTLSELADMARESELQIFEV